MGAKAITLASLALWASYAASLPQVGVAEVESLSTLNHREDCDLRLWVRADDLTPSTIVEGDVRLLNNMTKLSPDVAASCRILSWSLHLRHRERAAIQIPLKDAPLPKKPAYNYTWDGDYYGSRRYRADAMLSEGTDALSLFTNTTDPYEKEKAAYYQDLEEYVRTVQNADNWIVREDEATLFDIKQEAPSSTLDVREGLQISTFPFGVAVPNVHLPEEDQNNIHHFSSDDDESAKIKSNEEVDLSYYAEIHLANGSSVEIKGGRTKFFVPGGTLPLERKWTNFTLDGSSDCSCSFAKDAESCTRKKAKDAPEESKLFVSGSFEAPAMIRRGEKFLMQGHLLWDEAMNDKYILGKIRFDIQRRRDHAWAAEQIEKAASATDRTKTDIEDPIFSSFSSSSSFIRLGGDSTSFSSALYVEKELKEYEAMLRGSPTRQATPFGMFCRNTDPPSNAVPLTADATFKLDIVPPKPLSNLRSNLFVEDKLEWVIIVDAKERRPGSELSSQYTEKSQLADQEGASSDDLHQAFHNDTAQWTQYEDISLQLELLAAVGMDSEENGIKEKTKTFVARLPLTNVINQQVQLHRRNPLLSQIHVSQQALAQSCEKERKALYYLEEGARAPLFVDISTDEKIREAAALVNPCSLHSEHFPHISRAIQSIFHDPRDGSVATKRGGESSASTVLRYRRTRYSEPRGPPQDCQEGPGACGGAENDVGFVWANKVMLPRLKASLRAQARKGIDKIQTPDGSHPFVLQG